MVSLDTSARDHGFWESYVQFNLLIFYVMFENEACQVKKVSYHEYFFMLIYND